MFDISYWSQTDHKIPVVAHYPTVHALWSLPLVLSQYPEIIPENGRYTIKASTKERPYPLTLFMIVLPRVFDLVTNEVKIMNVVDTGIFNLVKMRRTIGAAT